MVVEKNDGEAVIVHAPIPVTEFGELQVTLCDDPIDGASTVMVSVMLLVSTFVRPAASCTWNAARTFLELW
jgi:hypothetical protein